MNSYRSSGLERAGQQEAAGSYTSTGRHEGSGRNRAAWGVAEGSSRSRSRRGSRGRKGAAEGGSRWKQQGATEVEVAKKVLVERELFGGGSRRKQQEAIEVEVAKKVLVERELRRGEQKEAAGCYRSRRRQDGPRRKRRLGGVEGCSQRRVRSGKGRSGFEGKSNNLNLKRWGK